VASALLQARRHHADEELMMFTRPEVAVAGQVEIYVRDQVSVGADARHIVWSHSPLHQEPNEACCVELEASNMSRQQVAKVAASKEEPAAQFLVVVIYMKIQVHRCKSSHGRALL
jgi:hypothetical protein